MRNIQKKKRYIQNLDLLKLFFSEYRNATAQLNWVVFIALANHTTGAIWRFLLSSPTFPLQSYSTVKPHFPLQRWESSGLKNSTGLYLSCDSVILIIISTRFAHLPSVSVQQHLPQHERKRKIKIYIYIYTHSYS